MEKSGSESSAFKPFLELCKLQDDYKEGANFTEHTLAA
jgi:hypothetical protein